MTLFELKRDFKLNDTQFSNLNLILQECMIYGCSKEQTTYIIATAYHESKLLPVDEISKGKGKPYGKKLKYKKLHGVHIPYLHPNKLYYGRGFVQLTWYELYEKMGKLLGIDLLNNPELALIPENASKILVTGMMKGLFTGAKLPKYINVKIKDYFNARQVVNILDKAELIKGYALKIVQYL